MAKIPDFSKLTEKFDLQGIVSNVKSIINPGSGVPESIKDDPLVPKISEVSALMQQILSVQAQQTEAMSRLNGLVNSLYRDLEAVKKANEAKANPIPTPEKEPGSTPQGE